MASRFWLALGILACAPLLHPQASPTATRRSSLQVGGAFSIANSDYAPQKFKGFTAYADYDFSAHFGVEAEFRRVTGPSSLGEKSYEIGGRYHRTYGRLSPFAKVMVGRGVFNFPQNAANLAYNMFAVGGGADYRIKPWLNARAEYEYQRWSGFPPNGLTPSLVTIGAAYRFR